MTLSAISVFSVAKGKRPVKSLCDLPRFANEEFGFRGLNIQTSLLAGWELSQFDELRDSADKSGCPCLLMVEDQPHELATPDEKAASISTERLERVLRVAHRGGCSGVVIGIKDDRAEDAAELAAERIKMLVSRAERLEINLLLVNSPGLTGTPEKLTELIRAVGGFRIGSAPDFELAAESGDPETYLRSLTPYASAVSVATREFDQNGVHKTYDLNTCLESIRSVGYDGTLSIEYRGKESPVDAIQATKTALDAFLEAPQP